jgi:lipopolysaccharide biosynthesis protein
MNRVAVFAHFDAQNEVKRYILHYLAALRAHCSRVIFVSVSKLPEQEQAKLRTLCDQVLLKNNRGFDFGMWKYALEHVDLASSDELLLVNSSVFGPITPLATVIERMSNDPCDVWAMTDNREHRWHLQSYFLVFKTAALHSAAFQDFWHKVVEFHDKKQVILSYEIGLSTFMEEHGFRLKPAFWQDAAANLDKLGLLRPRRAMQNPTCANPLALLSMGMPFVKVELLRDNPVKVRLAPVREALARTGYDTSLIEFDRPRQVRGWPFD